MSKVNLNGKKLLISTPSFDNMIPIDWMIALQKTLLDSQKYGVTIGFEATVRCSLINLARAEMVHQFLFEGDFDYLLCIDSDVIWNPDDVFQMLAKIDNHGIIVGPYPLKQDKPHFCTQLDFTTDKKPIISEDLLKIKVTGGGFMMLSREVLAGMYDKYPELHHKSNKKYLDKDHKMCAMFDTMIKDDEFLGEDIAFCHRLTDSGYDMWVDPEIKLTHIGNKKYNHSYKDYLLSKLED